MLGTQHILMIFIFFGNLWGDIKNWPQCLFLRKQCNEGTDEMEIAQSCLTLPSQGLYCPWNSPGQNTGIFTTQGSNSGLPHVGDNSVLFRSKGEPWNIQGSFYMEPLLLFWVNSIWHQCLGERLPWLVQWLRLHPPVQGARVWSLVRELDPTCCNEDSACCN